MQHAVSDDVSTKVSGVGSGSIIIGENDDLFRRGLWKAVIAHISCPLPFQNTADLEEVDKAATLYHLMTALLVSKHPTNLPC